MCHIIVGLSLRTFCSATGACGMDYLLARLNVSSGYKTGANILGNTSRARPTCLTREELYGLGSVPMSFQDGEIHG